MLAPVRALLPFLPNLQLQARRQPLQTGLQDLRLFFELCRFLLIIVPTGRSLFQTPFQYPLSEKSLLQPIHRKRIFAARASLDKTFAYFFTFFATTGTINTTIILKQESNPTT